MCQQCVKKAVATVSKIVALERAAGLVCASNGTVLVCVAAHNNHSHLRVRSGEDVGAWHEVPVRLPHLLQALRFGRFSVHQHEPWVDKEPEKAAPGVVSHLEAACGCFARVGTGQDSCSICLERLPTAVSGGHVTILPCGHAFHSSCARKWLARSTVCPECRGVVSEASIKRAS